ncbi:coenzyme F420 hydrogenase subunit beta [Desulfocicer vacuolatum DSM 3385]|uniref:Coenzyme F420 hydrogenase subunit beta n=1 Tax=Desulfocicer vacuolatum DSM 3385 TaxID=1121400 RepID=A0A1W2ERF5_9BACT|nr:Coenzyme F420 hydrogenase/dehydrogenase, beta subunit C-terminal domain [Desulfocicer vacuolatum]SMD11816.1 coenzyme F420 hydrogenase subunit beta [Desulfocicer vacuolatum DSM 3385]
MESTASNEVVRDVQQNGLCTGCGACVNLCPYFRNHRGKTIRLFECDRTWGRCYAYCPRTEVNLTNLRKKLFQADDLTMELGAFKGLYMTQAGDETVRNAAQHGGTVTALMKLALAEGIIDSAVVAGDNDQQVACPEQVDGPDQVGSYSKSKFILPPTVGKLNEALKGKAEKIGVVAVPCQAQAMAKMRVNPGPSDAGNMSKLKLVVGLFCGWAFDGSKLRELLGKELGNTAITGMDIPPSRHKCMEVSTENGMVCLPMHEIQTCVADGCGYCIDMTCEFSDISVGAARSPEGWDVDKEWNQVIVRSALGQTLMDLARDRGILNFKEVPSGNLEKLQNASMKKKRSCLAYLAEKSGREDDFIFLSSEDPLIRRIRGLE